MRQGFGTTWLGAVVVALLATACSPRFDWREQRGPPGTFMVALPGKPQTVSREFVVPANGATVRIEMSMLSAGVDASLFAVGTAALPAALVAPSALPQTLAWFRDGLARNVGTAVPVLATEAVAPAGLGDRRLLAAESFIADGTAGPRAKPAQLAARLYVVDDRLYQIVAIGAEGEVPPQALETFFDSFRLMPP